jgi:hypothetical protein
MLPRQCAAEFQDEIGNVVGNRFKLPDAVRCLEVHHRTDMQAPDRRVRVDTGDRAVRVDDLQEAVDVVAQLPGRDRRVLDERQGLVVALHRHRQPERRLAEAPDAGLVGQRQSAPPAAAEPGGRKPLLERVQARRQIVAVVAVELDAQQRGRIAHQNAAAERVERTVLLGVVEDEAVHHFDRRWMMAEHERRRCKRVEQVVELDGQHRLRRRQRYQVDLCGDDEPECAFRADDHLGQIERLARIGELVEVVAADPAQHLGEAAFDFITARRGGVPDAAIARGLEPGAGARRIELSGVERTEVRQ